MSRQNNDQNLQGMLNESNPFKSFHLIFNINSNRLTTINYFKFNGMLFGNNNKFQLKRCAEHSIGPVQFHRLLAGLSKIYGVYFIMQLISIVVAAKFFVWYYGWLVCTMHIYIYIHFPFLYVI